MIRLFKHYVPQSILLLGLIELAALFLSAEAAWQLRIFQIGNAPTAMHARLPQLLTYTLTVGLTMSAVGLYQPDYFRSLRLSATRMLVALGLSLVVLSVIFFVYPDVSLWRSILLYAALMSFGVILVVRALISRVVGLHRFRRRVLVLGAGARARRIAELAKDPNAGFTVVGYVRMTEQEPVVADAVDRQNIAAFDKFAAQLGVEEAVLAVEERRGALPVQDLLKMKLDGVRVSELSSFLERQTGRVDLRSASPSWLIFSDGFLGSQYLSVMMKRVFDVIVSGVLLLLTAPILLVAIIAVKLTSPGAVFYRQQRVGQLGKVFDVVKLRTMRNDAEKDGKPQWAQKSDPRVTSVGRVLRLTRIDEIPQIFNVFRGDMSFVGPRPERPFFVQDLAAQIPYYNERHVVKPGITGWAQINYPYGASLDDARHKLEYDLYYIKNYSLFLDMLIIVQTVRVVLFPSGVH